MRPFLAWILILASLARRSSQQQDQLQNFCRRFGHQTTVIDDRLYIDGGLVNYNPISQNPHNYTNNQLLYAELDVDNQGMPNQYENLTKPATAPSVSGGILWPDTVNKKFYLYGGEFDGAAPPLYETWEYDVLAKNWTQMNPDITQTPIQRASYGAGVTVQDRALAYLYGGWLSNASDATWTGDPVALSTFLEYDMIANTWTNNTGPDSVGRAEGIMVYIPASDSGMLIYLGGIQSSAPGNLTGQPMDEIVIYDIASSKWYQQKATGQVPDMRRRFCGGVAWTPDQSSYNIYLYGGAGLPPDTIGFDDVYILSLPSFTWIEWFPTSPPGTTYPHNTLTCNVINGNQMLILGGTFPNATTCDAPATYGFHNLDLSENNNQSAKWASFNNSKKGYTVPPEIVAVVGGSAQGSATLKAPTAGFDNPDLSVYFTRVYTAAVRTPTRAIPSGNSTSPLQAHKGAIIGGAVGGAVLILALATGCICFMGRQRKKRRVESSRAELLAQQSPQELFAPTNTLPFGQSPQHMYQQHPVQLPADERYQSPIEIGGHEISSTSDPYGSATTEKSTYSYQHPSPSTLPPSAHSIYAQGSPSTIARSAHSPYARPSSHSRHGSQGGSPIAIPYQAPPPGQQTYYPPPEEHNTPQSASYQLFTTPTPPYSNRSQAYSRSPADQQFDAPR